MDKNKGIEDSALFVMDGVEATHDGMQYGTPKIPKEKADSLNVGELAQQVRAGSRTHLSKAITLIESSNATHKVQAQELLQELLPHTGNSIRIGITGVREQGKAHSLRLSAQSFVTWENELLS